MPNYCSNVIQIVGPKKDIVEFDNKFKGISIDFSDYRLYEKKTEEELNDYIENLIKELKETKATNNNNSRVLLEILRDKITINEIDIPHYKCEITIPYKMEGYSFNNIVQLPINEIPNWYDWRCDNWGTKWDAISIYSSLKENGEKFENAADDAITESYYDFDTAWSPSLAITEKIGELYPSLKITHTYLELGSCFGGKEVIKGGEIVEEISVEDTKDVREFAYSEFGEDYEGRCPVCSCLIFYNDTIENDGKSSYSCPECEEEFELDALAEIN